MPAASRPSPARTPAVEASVELDDAVVPEVEAWASRARRRAALGEEQHPVGVDGGARPGLVVGVRADV